MQNKQIRLRAARVLSVWAQLAPNEKFGGCSLEEYRALMAKSDQYRQRLDELRARYLESLRLRDDADWELNEAYLKVVDGVKGHGGFGANSPLYKAMGYVPRDERRSGLTRKPAEEVPGEISVPPDSASTPEGTTDTP